MPENSAEMFNRVRLMARIDTDWDLSDKDTAALRHVLAAAEAREATQPSAAEVIEAAWWALQPFARGGVIDCLSRDDYSVMKERIVDWHGPSDFRAAVAAADLCTRWKEANGGK